MDENNIWIVCKHVMNGTADKVHVSKDKVCMCLACAEDPTMMETEEFNILDEPLLMERLKAISDALEMKGSGNVTIRNDG